MAVLLEICAFSVVDARRAAAAGADRIELCREPAADGLTPSDDDLAEATELLATLPVHPIVRPRAQFTADLADQRAMALSLRRVRDLGFPGAVIGVLDATGQEPDWPALERLLAPADGLALTFHRAFDHVTNKPRVLRSLADLGFARVLTSGGAGHASEHRAELAQLARLGTDYGIIVMAGGGVTSSNLAELRAAGLVEVHASAGGSTSAMSEAEVAALAVAARGDKA